jgi:hypothetical protein
MHKMNKKLLLIYLEIILILILFFSYGMMDYRIKIFSRDCRITYDVNGTCPCKEPKIPEKTPFYSVNFTQIPVLPQV